MSDSTPITVSDRMGKKVDALMWEAFSEGGGGEYPTLEAAQDAADDLKREIGWLETVIDQRYKRIQELEVVLAGLIASRTI